jgi:hypothetical protein
MMACIHPSINTRRERTLMPLVPVGESDKHHWQYRRLTGTALKRLRFWANCLKLWLAVASSVH